MSNDFVTIATFQFLTEAEVSKLALEAEGIKVFLADVETVSMDWMIGNAIGYIKLQVPGSQVEAAVALLEQVRAEHQRHEGDDEDAESEKCLSCGVPLPPDATLCPACGWTYASDGEVEKEDDAE